MSTISEIQTFEPESGLETSLFDTIIDGDGLQMGISLKDSFPQMDTEILRRSTNKLNLPEELNHLEQREFLMNAIVQAKAVSTSNFNS